MRCVTEQERMPPMKMNISVSLWNFSAEIENGTSGRIPMTQSTVMSASVK